MTAGPDPSDSPRSAVVTSQSLRPPVALVMACWHRNRQFTHSPAPARRRRVDMNVAKTSTAATAALAAATGRQALVPVRSVPVFLPMPEVPRWPDRPLHRVPG